MTPERLEEINQAQQDSAWFSEYYGSQADPVRVRYASYVGDLLAERAELRDALQAMLDAQNGPPLIRDEAAWRAACERARGLLAQ